MNNMRLWGPYLAERAWGTVREDYSADGSAWEYFSFGQSSLRAYRWSEDGIAGISDIGQRLCFALALWNGQDPILKERLFGLTNGQGNRGEDVKEYYFHLAGTPKAEYLSYLYKYPHTAFPYDQLVIENGNRSRNEAPFSLLDTGVFSQDGYWDVKVEYAKASSDVTHIHIEARNLGKEKATLHLVPNCWFRNTWSWDNSQERPSISSVSGKRPTLQIEHPTLGKYFLYVKQSAKLLFTENETNKNTLWGVPNDQPYVKDAFHRYIIQGEKGAVNPAEEGTKAAVWTTCAVASGETTTLDLVLSAKPSQSPFANHEAILSEKRREERALTSSLLPNSSLEDKEIFSKAMAGMVWSQQYYNYDVGRWLDGDDIAPPSSRHSGRNRYWRHLKSEHVISMPDTWEYPWFAAWDLAYQSIVYALFDIELAKEQIAVLLTENMLNPNGQIPAYEWSFSDTNPPVHAMGALEVFRAERQQKGAGDIDFLQRVFHKLLLTYSWWINRKDSKGLNVFEGGFLGLDNISVFDRSQKLPPGYSLKQADATGWMASFALTMTLIALELTTRYPAYEDIAIQCYEQFHAIANTIGGHISGGTSLWDGDDGFFKDLVTTPDGRSERINVFSLVGIIPLFATEVLEPRLLKAAPRFHSLLDEHRGGMFDGHTICACPSTENSKGERLLSIVDHMMLPHILKHILNEDEFLADFGVRSLSKIHAYHKELGTLPGLGEAIIEYVPGESNSGMFGGNSNWRGPIWFPLNYSLIQALRKFHRYLGDGLKVRIPGKEKHIITLDEVAQLIAKRLIKPFRFENGRRVSHPVQSPFQSQILFYEYFHAETGQGLGAAHQTGWTGLVANLIAYLAGKGIPVV